jgi:hypothetical protein
MTLKVYGHVVEEYRGQPAIDIAARVRAVRGCAATSGVPCASTHAPRRDTAQVVAATVGGA